MRLPLFLPHLLLSFPPSFILSFLIFFFYHSTSALYYFFLFPSHTPIFPCVLSTLITLSLSPAPLTHSAPPGFRCKTSEGTDFISDAMCHASQIRRAPAVMESWPCSALIVSILCHPIALSSWPTPLSPLLISPVFPPSVLSALAIYNMAISGLWQTKDLLHGTNCSLESRARKLTQWWL